MGEGLTASALKLHAKIGSGHKGRNSYFSAPVPAAAELDGCGIQLTLELPEHRPGKKASILGQTTSGSQSPSLPRQLGNEIAGFSRSSAIAPFLDEKFSQLLCAPSLD